MKEIKIDGELVSFKYDRKFNDWGATFTEKELRSFVKRIKLRSNRR